MAIAFNKTDNDFYVVLQKKVSKYFESEGLKPTGSIKLYFKTGLLMTVAVLTYLLILLGNQPGWVNIFLCALMGISFSVIGFNIMHDGAHGSYSNKRWINEMMAYSLNLMGGCSYLWKIKHNVNHHTFTNIEGHDGDLDIKPFLRTNANQKKHWFHRYQHIYWVFLYGLSYLSIIYGKNFKEYFSGKIDGVRLKKMNTKEHVIFWLSKSIYLFLFIVLPLFKFGVLKVVIGYIVLAFACGFVLSIVFQLAHVVEGTNFPEVDKATKKIEQDWAIHQVSTTANFATNNKVISWFLGGLNFQIEHHLFPRISHVHYPQISILVREACAEFNIRYIEYPTVFKAIKSHISYLKFVGNQ